MRALHLRGEGLDFGPNKADSSHQLTGEVGESIRDDGQDGDEGDSEDQSDQEEDREHGRQPGGPGKDLVSYSSNLSPIKMSLWLCCMCLSVSFFPRLMEG